MNAPPDLSDPPPPPVLEYRAAVPEERSWHTADAYPGKVWVDLGYFVAMFTGAASATCFLSGLNADPFNPRLLSLGAVVFTLSLVLAATMFQLSSRWSGE